MGKAELVGSTGFLLSRAGRVYYYIIVWVGSGLTLLGSSLVYRTLALLVDPHGANDCCEDWRACSHWPLGVPEEHGLWESQKSTASWLTVCLRFRD